MCKTPGGSICVLGHWCCMYVCACGDVTDLDPILTPRLFVHVPITTPVVVPYNHARRLRLEKLLCAARMYGAF
jgi:hypothetical protein